MITPMALKKPHTGLWLKGGLLMTDEGVVIFLIYLTRFLEDNWTRNDNSLRWPRFLQNYDSYILIYKMTNEIKKHFLLKCYMCM